MFSFSLSCVELFGSTYIKDKRTQLYFVETQVTMALLIVNNQSLIDLELVASEAELSSASYSSADELQYNVGHSSLYILSTLVSS